MRVKIHWDIVLEHMNYLFVEELSKRAPVHDGALRQSISGKVINEELKIFMVEYAYYIDQGTSAHWTSVENLKKWAKDKLGDENAAYAIQKKIAVHGTKPNPFIRETIKQKGLPFLKKALKQKGAVSVYE